MIETRGYVDIGISTGNCLAEYRNPGWAKSKGAKVMMVGIQPTIFPEEPLESPMTLSGETPSVTQTEQSCNFLRIPATV
jgi:hypothetical protein